MKKITISLIALLLFTLQYIQSQEQLKIDKEWLAKIEQLAPSETTVKNMDKKKILIFSKATGFDHWAIPHNSEMLKIVGKKTNAFEVHVKYDIEQFENKNLQKYDAVVFNNCNPSGPERDLFTDLLRQNSSLSDTEIIKMAPE
jgi:hypothetical protein